jgi:tripartite-type tricarboxylate transporter receptor subunit TctC
MELPMTLIRRDFLTIAGGALGAALVPSLARAQDYPTRPITMVVPFAAGGPVDTYARILSERMRVSLGQPVIVENVAGAGGSIGVGRVARAVPDGYTIVIGIWSTHVANGAVYSLDYDVLNDFEPIALQASSPQVIVARKSLPAADLKGMITWLKANPEKATSGTAGAGSPQHVIGTFFQSVTGTRFQFAAYRSGAQAMQDLLAERIDIMIDSQTISLPQVCDGRIKAFAVTSMTRSAVAPDIPTVDEAGLPGFHFSVWNATWAPKGTPRNIVGKLNTAVVEALADAQVRAPHGSGPGNFPARATDPGSALRFAEGRDREMVAHYQSRGDQD